MRFVQRSRCCLTSEEPSGYTVGMFFSDGGKVAAYQAVYGESLNGTVEVVDIVRGIDMTKPDEKKAAAQRLRAACEAHHAARSAR